MNRLGFIISSLWASAILIGGGQAKEVYFELNNDPQYPQLVAVSNVEYQLVGNKHLEFSGILTVHEEIDDGTNVSVCELKPYFSFKFPFFYKKIDFR